MRLELFPEPCRAPGARSVLRPISVGLGISFVLLAPLLTLGCALLGDGARGVPEGPQDLLVAMVVPPPPKMTPEDMKSFYELPEPVEVYVAPTDYQGVPFWVLRGIAAQETRSSIADDGTVTWVDHRVGKAGELGVMQMTQGAFEMVHHKGETFWRLHKDPQYALALAVRYLTYLKARDGTWEKAVASYNAGKHWKRAGKRYCAEVKAKAGV